jgi:hypothetical protein
LRTLIDTGTIATSHLFAISSAISQRAWSATVAQRGLRLLIDSLSSKSKHARDPRPHPQLVEKYEQAISAAAFQGELTDARLASNNSFAVHGASIRR